MRTAFIQALIREARLNPRLFLVVGDLGFSVVEPFAAEFPDRFLNAGVAEQNMTGLAAGLASEGYQVFTYSIANFPTLRCLEQIRNDVCYHRAPVVITSVGAGVAYGNLGYSHHAVQDLAVMLSMPHLTVLSPADPGETEACVQYACAHPGPAYLRLGKAGEKSLHSVRGIDEGPLLVRNGDCPVALVATGSILKVALEAAELFASRTRTQLAVFSCPRLKPCSRESLGALWDFPHLITLEEHVATGGLGDLLRRLQPPANRIVSLALDEAAASLVGSQDFLRAKAGLTVDAVMAAAEQAIRSA